jgi:hypothetical protein
MSKLQPLREIYVSACILSESNTVIDIVPDITGRKTHSFYTCVTDAIQCDALQERENVHSFYYQK